mmetsp:Transcript_10252/g.17641  ORF Transcript_10252/g.17641 Transcript_10252/m.17641 type:complete len:448 (-) Transcript_10252:316-1659(-)|eukprot:CAMPEP_0198201918 /NCGR_PEP_ID=MMETSP1445-20131203/4944_1 /TAXON_ID=36898 /ORGANISM="Pyramimonas sp., Strain CCMP2087" /LENGTH=447 /DNA_ID=CAMNT_0043872573 /DNA_START=350 /DNA_END=1693 /DNA_ORIENTATION=-
MSVAIDGYLKKKSSKKSLLSRGWNKRWFALAGDTLSYSDSPREKTPSGVFKVANLKDIFKSSEQVFELVFEERSLVLKANDAVELKRWMKAIEGARQYIKGLSTDPNMSLRDQQAQQRNAYASKTIAVNGSQVQHVQQGRRQDEEKEQEEPPSPRKLLASPSKMEQAKAAKGNAFGTFWGKGSVESPSRESDTSEVCEATEVMQIDLTDTYSPQGLRKPPSHKMPHDAKPPQIYSSNQSTSRREDQRIPGTKERVPLQRSQEPALIATSFSADFDQVEDSSTPLRIVASSKPTHGIVASSKPQQQPHVVKASPHKAVLPPAEKDWDNWDSESDGGSDADENTKPNVLGPEAHKGGEGRNHPGAAAMHTTSWSGGFERQDQNHHAHDFSTAIRPVTPMSTTDTMKGAKGTRPHTPNLKPPLVNSPKQKTPGVQADDKWVEEDWDSDEE